MKRRRPVVAAGLFTLAIAVGQFIGGGGAAAQPAAPALPTAPNIPVETQQQRDTGVIDGTSSLGSKVGSGAGTAAGAILGAGVGAAGGCIASGLLAGQSMPVDKVPTIQLDKLPFTPGGCITGGLAGAGAGAGLGGTVGGPIGGMVGQGTGAAVGSGMVIFNHQQPAPQPPH